MLVALQCDLSNLLSDYELIKSLQTLDFKEAWLNLDSRDINFDWLKSLYEYGSAKLHVHQDTRLSKFEELC